MAAAKPTLKRCIVCLGANAWGKGNTEAEAVKNWRKEVGTFHSRKEIEVVIVDAPASFNINEVTGGIMRHKDSPPAVELKRVKLTIR